MLWKFSLACAKLEELVPMYNNSSLVTRVQGSAQNGKVFEVRLCSWMSHFRMCGSNICEKINSCLFDGQTIFV